VAAHDGEFAPASCAKSRSLAPVGDVRAQAIDRSQRTREAALPSPASERPNRIIAPSFMKLATKPPCALTSRSTSA
jgi:hypothetical protein